MSPGEENISTSVAPKTLKPIAISYIRVSLIDTASGRALFQHRVDVIDGGLGKPSTGVLVRLCTRGGNACYLGLDFLLYLLILSL